MSERTHDAFEARLSEYLDGEMDRREAEAVEAHLEVCASCRTLAADLGRVRERAGSLEDRGPERDLWPGILAGMERSRVIDLAEHLETGPSTPAGSRDRRGIFLSLPQLGAAAAALVVLAAGGAWGLAWTAAASARGPDAGLLPAVEGVRPVAAVSSDAAPVTGPYAAEVAELQDALRRGRDRLDPHTVRILEKNLALIDGAIRESMDALAVDPGNAFVERHLQRSYERKVTYLREATALLELSD